MAHRRRHRKTRHHAMMGNPIHHRRHRRRHHFLHNPVGGVMAQTKRIFAPAVTGAIGALSVNALVNYALPETMKATLLDGRTAYVTKGALAVLLGLVASKVGGLSRYSHELATGALTVTLTDLGKDLALSYGGMNLSGTGYINPAFALNPRLTGGARSGVGYYLPRPGAPAAINPAARMRGMGYYVHGVRR